MNKMNDITELNEMNDHQLHQNTLKLVRSERQILTLILRHLLEVEQRRLFSSHQCPSLFDYCVRELGYSEGQAQRRISAMRLMRELPQIEEKMASGVLSLSNVAQAQTFFRQEAKLSLKSSTPVEKLSVLEKLENKSAREAEKTLFSISQQEAAVLKERTRVVSESHIELRLQLTEEQMQKLKLVRGRWAHQIPNANFAEVISALCDLALKESQPPRPKTTPKTIVPPTESLSTSAVKSGTRLIPEADVTSDLNGRGGQVMAEKTTSGKRKAIPVKIKREVWERDGHKCTQCGGEYALQVDHIQPVSCGGTNDITNLRILCRTCNQRAAILLLGREKMQRHLSL